MKHTEVMRYSLRHWNTCSRFYLLGAVVCMHRWQLQQSSVPLLPLCRKIHPEELTEKTRVAQGRVVCRPQACTNSAWRVWRHRGTGQEDLVPGPRTGPLPPANFPACSVDRVICNPLLCQWHQGFRKGAEDEQTLSAVTKQKGKPALL